jgi:Spy/CpxP family protein refolding chaperone
MKASKWIVITLAAGLGAGGLTVLKAHSVESELPQRHFRGQFIERAKEKLGLSDDQTAKIKTEIKAEKDNLTSLISKLHEARAGLRTAIQASDSTEASVRATSAKVAAVEADLAEERLKLYGRINPVLTDEQRQKVKAFQARIDDFVDGMINRIGDRLAE